MASNQVALRYSKALLQVAKDKNFLREVYLNMKYLNIAHKKHPEIKKILKDQVTPNSTKNLFIKNILKEIHPLTINFLILLQKKRRISELIEIAKSFLSRYNNSKDLKTIHMTTTVKLSEILKTQLKKDMKDKLKCAKIKIIEYIDPSILGGYILRVGDKQIDASISLKLKKMRNAMINS